MKEMIDESLYSFVLSFFFKSIFSMVFLFFLEEWNTFFIGALDTGEFCEWRVTHEAGKAVANSVGEVG